jgi:hypothetical protein
MAFRDSLKKYREAQVSQSTTTSGTSKQSTSGSAGGGSGSFRDSLAKYRAAQGTDSVQGWIETSINLVNDVQTRSQNWFDNSEYLSQYDRITSQLATADAWRKKYAGDDEAISYIDSVVEALTKAKDYSFSNYNYYSQWGNADEYAVAYEKMKEYYDKWGRYADEADFEEYAAKGAAIKNPTRGDAEGVINLFGWRPGAEDVGNIVTYSRDNYNQLVADMADRYDSVGDHRYHYMTDDEVAIYNYLLAKEGGATAKNFLDYMEETLNAREGGQIAKNITEIDIPVVEDLAKLAYGFGAGVDQFGSGVKQLVSGDKLPTSSTQFANAQIAESTGWGKYAYTAANTIGNMFPSILVGTLTGGTGGAVAMGASAAGNAYGQALEKGYSKLQARAYSTLVGASDGTLQYLLGGIGKLGGVSSSKILSKVAAIDNSLLRISAKLGVEIGSEILEEEIQNFLEPAFRSIIFGEEYDAPTIDELVETAIVTALSTGVLEGGTTITGDVNNSRYYTNTYGNVQRDLVDQALSDGEGFANSLAQKYKQKMDAGGSLTGTQIRKLLEANQEQITTNDMKTGVTARRAEWLRLLTSGPSELCTPVMYLVICTAVFSYSGL